MRGMAKLGPAILLGVALFASALLGGCAPQVVYAAGDGIVFSDPAGEPNPDVFRVARAHCDRFGKRTRYDGVEGGQRLKFQCIE
jgi:hypothetical protein